MGGKCPWACRLKDTPGKRTEMTNESVSVGLMSQRIQQARCGSRWTRSFNFFLPSHYNSLINIKPTEPRTVKLEFTCPSALHLACELPSLSSPSHINLSLLFPSPGGNHRGPIVFCQVKGPVGRSRRIFLHLACTVHTASRPETERSLTSCTGPCVGR